MLLFNEDLDTVEKFFNVCSTRLTLYARIALVEKMKSGIHRNVDCDLVRVFRIGTKTQFSDDVTELSYLLYSSRFQPVIFKVITICRLKKRHLVMGCSSNESRQRSVADSSCRLVDNPLERLVIVNIYNQLEIRHHILYLGPFKERIAGVNHVRKVPAPEGFLEGTRLRICSIENCKILVLSSFRLNTGQDGRRNEQSFFLFCISLDEFDLLAFRSHGIAFLRNPR